MVVGSAALDLPVVRFKGRPDRAAALRAVGEPLRGLAAGLHAAGRVAPPCGGSLKSEEGAFRAAQLAAATANLPDLAQGLPLPLSAGVVNICPRGRSFRSDAEIARYVDGLLASSWWKRRYRHVDRVRVLRGAERRSTVHEERAGQLDMKVKPSGAVTWTLAVQPDYRCELVVLHELVVLALRRGALTSFEAAFRSCHRERMPACRRPDRHRASPVGTAPSRRRPFPGTAPRCRRPTRCPADAGRTGVCGGGSRRPRPQRQGLWA